MVCLCQSRCSACNMEALQAEIASKRKAIQDDSILSDRPSKYMKRGDLERLREERQVKTGQVQTSPEDPSKSTRVSTPSLIQTRMHPDTSMESSHLSFQLLQALPHHGIQNLRLLLNLPIICLMRKQFGGFELKVNRSDFSEKQTRTVV
jgi:hypothetical protein